MLQVLVAVHEKVEVVIDTDVGDDIDDALALALACKSPEVKLLAVTTVYGRVDLRARLASAILSACGIKRVPVAKGCPKPIVSEGVERDPLYYSALKPCEGVEGVVEDHAVDLLIELSKEHEGLTLVTLGPLTNVALAILKDPGFAKRVRIISMAGCYFRPIIEYNVRCDPEAMYVLLRSGAKPLLVGLDVTLKCAMSGEHVAELRRRRTRCTELLVRLLEAWSSATSRLPVLHDPLALALSYRRGLVDTTSARVLVELAGKATRGLTLIADGGFEAMVCSEVRERELLELFVERVTA